MKPNDYIKKHKLQNGWNNSRQDAFLTDINNDFEELYVEAFERKKGDVKAFRNIVSVIHQKWESISRKIPFGLPDKLWNYFYATTICSRRDMLFPDLSPSNREALDSLKADDTLSTGLFDEYF